MRHWKRITFVILGSGFLFCSIAAGVNFLVDPLWSFDHDVLIGRYQVSFDERQQKTNWLAFHKVEYDTVILGNSRVTYMDTKTVPGRAFNYSANSMKPSEYLPYLKFASSRSSMPIKTVLLGLSFGDTNGANVPAFERPEGYISHALSFGYRIKSLLNSNVLTYAVDSIHREIQGNVHSAYIRQGRKVIAKKMVLPVPESELQKEIADNLETYRKNVYGRSYTYQDNKEIYRALRTAFPDAKFYIFTTPVTDHLLKLLVGEDRLNDYERWITDLVDVFGEVWHFMYFNSVTGNGENFKDAHHYSPRIAEVIVRKLFGLETEKIYEDFGMKITRESVREKIIFLRQNMMNK